MEQTSSRAQQIHNFIALLRQWAHPDKGVIPYVWGGASVTQTETDTFNKKTTQVKSKPISFFTRNTHNQSTKSGLDCAGMIARAAQICGIPFFLKNTYTIAQVLKPLQKNESLHEGDIIWIPGHVMVVANLQKNTLIEARSYDHGFGKVQEIELHKVFKDMHTYNDLRKALLNQQPLVRLDKKGKPTNRFSRFKLLKLSSVWH